MPQHSDIPPNELADLYEAFFTLLEHLPEKTHPGWVLAIESILFGGEGLAEGAVCYGEQQSERNDFKITAYRELYGNDTRVTNFHTIETEQVTPTDLSAFDAPVRLPVTPLSKMVLPIFVDDDNFSQAISLLEEFPAEPDAIHPGNGQQRLLNPAHFPGLSADSEVTKQESEFEYGSRNKQSDINSNELAEIYDGLSSLFRCLSDTAHPIWKEAIETMLFGGEYLLPGRSPYSEQQAKRNEFTIAEYRNTHGDGKRVTEFTRIECSSNADSGMGGVVLNAPESARPLPHSPVQEDLEEALLLLEEFPAIPAADDNNRSDNVLLFTEGLLEKAGIQSTELNPESDSPSSGTPIEPAEPADESDKEILLTKGAGESMKPIAQSSTEDRFVTGSRKYEDPRAQRAHERAQQRDPSDVVELGEEIELILQEVDRSYAKPTIMGRKNKLVIFVEEAPQDVSRFDKIRAKIVNYGGNGNCAHAVFIGYAD